MCEPTISEPFVYRVHVWSLFGMFDMCKLTFSEPLIYRVYVLIAITFYLACFQCANQRFLNHCIYTICLVCHNILFGMFEMWKPMISEPLVYRVYVWSAITFYLACLTCWKLTFSELLVYRVYVRSAIVIFIWPIWHVWTDDFWTIDI